MSLRYLLLLLLWLPGACTYQYGVQLADQALDHSETRDRHTLQRTGFYTVPASSQIFLPKVALADLPAAEAEQLQADLARQLREYFSSVRLGSGVASVEEALQQAHSLGAGFVFYVELTEYRDQHAGLMEVDEAFKDPAGLGLDHLQLRFSVWDIQSGQLIDSALVTSRTPVLQIRSHQAHELARGAIDQYLQQLVAVP